MTDTRTIKCQIPFLNYEFSDTGKAESLDNAFDILFEETIKKFGNLTAMDN